MPNLQLPGNIRCFFACCKLTADICSGNGMAELLNDPLFRLGLFGEVFGPFGPFGGGLGAVSPMYFGFGYHGFIGALFGFQHKTMPLVQVNKVGAYFALPIIKLYGAFKRVVGFMHLIRGGPGLLNPQLLAKLRKKQLIIGTFGGAGGFQTGDE